MLGGGFTPWPWASLWLPPWPPIIELIMKNIITGQTRISRKIGGTPAHNAIPTPAAATTAYMRYLSLFIWAPDRCVCCVCCVCCVFRLPHRPCSVIGPAEAKVPYGVREGHHTSPGLGVWVGSLRVGARCGLALATRPVALLSSRDCGRPSGAVHQGVVRGYFISAISAVWSATISLASAFASGFSPWTTRFRHSDGTSVVVDHHGEEHLVERRSRGLVEAGHVGVAHHPGHVRSRAA